MTFEWVEVTGLIVRSIEIDRHGGIYATVDGPLAPHRSKVEVLIPGEDLPKVGQKVKLRIEVEA